ncbi:MAG: peptide chain release factor-like protein [Phycisphaerae bacterium]|nr:peptide chain release factor-like protein [Phycisphaerae bacterium]
MTPPPSKPTPPDAPRLSDEQLRERLNYDDARLLAECEVHLHRVSGPGGQHRNKVSSAVRLRHRPSGLVVSGTERRSQHENKAKAVGRLREALALHARAPLPEQVAWPENIQIQDRRLRVNEKNPARHHVIALVLDALFACGGNHREAAQRLGVTASSLARFLAAYPKVWAEANRIRKEAGLPALRK